MHKSISTMAVLMVQNVKNAMMLNIGGGATTNYVFIVGR